MFKRKLRKVVLSTTTAINNRKHCVSSCNNIVQSYWWLLFPLMKKALGSLDYWGVRTHKWDGILLDLLTEKKKTPRNTHIHTHQIKEELLCFSVVSDLKNIVTMSDSHVKQSHSITQWGTHIWKWVLQAASGGLHAAFQQFFLFCFVFNSVVTLTSLHGELPYMGMSRHASSVHTVLCLPSSPLCSLLHRVQKVVWHGFFSVNDGKLALIS